MSTLRLLVRQIRYENRAFWRNPAAAFFTFAFPLIFMFVFQAIFGTQVEASGLTAAAFFTPAIVAFSIVNACFTTLAMTVVSVREEGILKRVRGTPLPSLVYLAARIAHSVLVGLLLVVVVSAFGAVAYHVPFPWTQLPLLVLTLFLGSACFCALGLAVSGIVPNERAAPAVVNAIILPLLFISDVFLRIPPDNFLAKIGNVFPVRHFAIALQGIWTPAINGPVDPMDLVWVAGWAVIGVLLAIRTFSWEPRG
jgi:ABC-2 type transport system permease protein